MTPIHAVGHLLYLSQAHFYYSHVLRAVNADMNSHKSSEDVPTSLHEKRPHAGRQPIGMQTSFMHANRLGRRSLTSRPSPRVLTSSPALLRCEICRNDARVNDKFKRNSLSPLIQTLIFDRLRASCRHFRSIQHQTRLDETGND